MRDVIGVLCFCGLEHNRPFSLQSGHNVSVTTLTHINVSVSDYFSCLYDVFGVCVVRASNDATPYNMANVLYFRVQSICREQVQFTEGLKKCGFCSLSSGIWA